ncbi:MAG: hypothetical protein WDZ76_10925 [Pseudohongiellaceae bacterium]
MHKMIVRRALTLLVVGLLSFALQAQQIARRGSIESINQDAGFIVVSGIRLPYSEGSVRVRYQGRDIRTTFLAPGLLITYRLNPDGTIGDIILLGPLDRLEQIDRH